MPVPLQTIDVGWVAVVVALVAPGLVAGLVCAPFLAAERVRALFRTLPPRDGVVGSYVGAALLGAVPFYAVTLAALSAAERGALGGGPAPLSNALLGAIPVLFVGYAAGVPAVAGSALPVLGYDWDPAGYGPGTWALLAGLGAVYAATFLVPLFLFAAILSFPA